MSTWFAPGRVEILGKHTDYAGGRSLLMTLDRGVSVSIDDAAAGLWCSSDAIPGEVSLRQADPLPDGHWGHYLRAVVARLEHNFGRLRPARLTVTSTLPMASGMSSSSALTVAASLALIHHNHLDEDPRWTRNITTPEELATYLATMENGASFRELEGRRGVGTFGGSQDHTAIVCCRPDFVARYSFRGVSPRLEDSIAWDPAVCLVVAMSGVAAEKTGAARQRYNRLAELTARITQRWNAATGRDDANIGQALASGPEAETRLAALLSGEPALSRRFDQFVTESERCIPAAAECLRAGDFAGFGEVAAISQRGADEGLANQIDETRFLVNSALERGAHAASAFGAGFGGSVWALLPASDAEAFSREWLAEYQRTYPQHAERASVIVSTPQGGAREIGATT